MKIAKLYLENKWCNLKKGLVKSIREIYEDKLLFNWLVIMIVCSALLLLLSFEIFFKVDYEILSIAILFIKRAIILVMLLSFFVIMFALYTIDCRALEREFKKITGLESINFNFPKDLILSLLRDENEIVNDNEKVFTLVRDNVKKLDGNQIMFTLTRIKLYKNPMSIRDTVITIIVSLLGLISYDFFEPVLDVFLSCLIFYGAVFLTWYFSNRRKMYICNVLEEFLNFRLVQLEQKGKDNFLKNRIRKYK